MTLEAFGEAGEAFETPPCTSPRPNRTKHATLVGLLPSKHAPRTKSMPLELAKSCKVTLFSLATTNQQ